MAELVQIEIPELNGAPPPKSASPPQPSPSEDHSGEINPDATAAAEYALHILFTQFVRHAERKLAIFQQVADDAVEKSLGEGVDPEFDQIIASLGHVARRRPKPVIDSVMYWRKSKRDQPGVGSLASIYILTRVLMDVVRQTPPEVFGEELSEKLEDIVFRQIATTDAGMLASSQARRANWKLLARLLGIMSTFRFASVADRFVEELERPPSPHHMQLLEALPYLRLSLYPEDMLEEASNLMSSLAKFAGRAPTQSGLRQAYSDAITSMLLPLAEQATVEVNQPMWAAAVAQIYALGADRRAPHTALATAALCLSPRDFFAEHWLQLLESQVGSSGLGGSTLAGIRRPSAMAITPKSSAPPAVFVWAAQLSWTYVFRCPESLNAMTRKLDALRRLLLNNLGRKYWQALDSSQRRACESLLRSAFSAYRQHTLDDLLFPLLVGADAGHVVCRPTLAPDQVVPERSSLAVSAFSGMMRDLRTGERPSFPYTSVYAEATKSEVSEQAKTSQTSVNDPSIPAPLRESIELFERCVCQIAAGLADNGRSLQTPVSALVGFTSAQPQQVDIDQAHRYLLDVALKSWPSWWPLSEGARELEVLSRACLAEIAGTSGRATAQTALKALGREPGVSVPKVLAAATKTLLAASDGPHVETMLRVYVALLEAWVPRLKGDHDPAVWSTIEEVEGNGLLFLSSRDRSIRALALRVLYLVTELDAALLVDGVELPSRVIGLLQTKDIAPLLEGRSDLSMPERARVAKFHGRRGASLARLAGSDYGVDAALWLKVFPQVVRYCFESHPVPVALFRSAACERLLAMHPAVASLVDGPTRGGTEIIEQWRLYLMAVCATLTATDEQKLHVPSHSRKKSAQRITLHHQRITSARSAFRIAIPFLGAAHSGVRDAAIAGLACTNVNTYRTLLECLHPVLMQDLAKVPSSSAATRLVTGVVDILRQTSQYLNDPWKVTASDSWICDKLIAVLQAVRAVLASSAVPLGLYRVFCGLVADVYLALGPKQLFGKASGPWIQFWSLIESWSPFGGNAAAVAAVSAANRSGDAVAQAQHEFERRELDRATTRALAALLRESTGLLDEANLSGVLRWVYAVISTSQPVLQQSGMDALENLLLSHPSSPLLIEEVVVRSLGSQGLARTYFSVLVKVCEAKPDVLSHFPQLEQFIALALFKLGDFNRETRAGAVRLVELVEVALYGDSIFSSEFDFRLRSDVPAVFKREIFVLSQRLATARPSESRTLFGYMTRTFQLVADPDRRDIPSVLLPWLQNIELGVNGGADDDAVLASLLEVTVVFSSRMPHEVEALWVALCTPQPCRARNALAILDFVTDLCLRHRTPTVLDIATRILVYLQAAPVEAAQAVTEKLLSYLEPQNMIHRESPNQASPQVQKVVNMIMQAASRSSSVVQEHTAHDSSSIPPFSYGQLATVFLVNTLPVDATLPPAKLLTIFHVSLTLADHFVDYLSRKARELVLVASGVAGVAAPEKMMVLDELLATAEWSYKDDQGRVPDTLKQVIELISQMVPAESLAQWPMQAVHWATACPVRHIASRSFQILRCLGPTLNQKMLGNMLARLSTTISEPQPEIQGFAIQILMTLNAVTDQLDSIHLLQFPQLFWTTVAALGTTNEREYIEVLSIMGKLITKWDWVGASEILRSSFPARWDRTEFGGVLPLILHGLRSANAEAACYETLDLLLSAPPEAADLLWGENSLALFLSAYLIRMAHVMDAPAGADAEDTRLSAARLRDMVGSSNPGLTRVLDSFARSRFWSKSDFISQYIHASLRTFPDQAPHSLKLFMSVLSNRLAWVRTETLAILKILLPEVDLESGDGVLAGRGADIVSPLLRLLQTQWAEQALGVLDNAGAILSGKMDRHILRISLGSRALAKEYENTDTLFGIPEDSGWAVPNPTATAACTRNNVHAVFYTCDASMSQKTATGNFTVDGDNLGGEAAELTPVQFQQDEYPGSLVDAQRTGSIDETQSAGRLASLGSMDRMLTVLDDFDSFFTKVSAASPSGVQPASSAVHPLRSQTREHAHISNPSMAMSMGSFGIGNTTGVSARSRSISDAESFSVPQLYDKKISVILNHSLNRTPSQVSFRTGLADSYRAHHLASESSTGLHHPLRQDSIASVSADSQHTATDVSILSSDSTPPGQSSSIGVHTPTIYDREVTASYTPTSSSPSPHSPTSQVDSTSKSKSRSQADSSFRLESLLLGKRRSRKADRRKSPDAGFQFP